MDIIFLRELKVTTLIGIYEREKIVPQTLQIDLDIALPNSRACTSDDINDALDYADVAQHIQTVLSEGHFSLLETLAEHIAQIILKDFNAPWVKVNVAKLQAIRNCKMVGISIERGQCNKSNYPSESITPDILKTISGKYCPRFGQTAVEMGFITESQLKKALIIQTEENLSGQKHRLLGAILFDKEWMTSDQVETVLNSLLEKTRQEE
jgi:dihydroneopterin aldolase